MAPLECFHFRPFASARLSSRNRSSTQASALWTPVTLPSAAVAAVACYHHWCRPPPLLPLLLPPPLAATAAASSSCCRRTLLPPLLTAASVTAARSRCLPPFFLSAAAAAAAASGLCHRWSLPPPSAAPAVALHGWPGATSIGGGGSGDRGNPGRACRNPCGAFLKFC